MVVANVHTQSRADGQTPTIRTIPVAVLGMSLSLFLAISFVLCIVGYLVLPGLPVKHEALAIFLPGFELLTWRGFAIGLVESYAWGWYIALVLGTSTTSLPGGRRLKGEAAEAAVNCRRR